MKNFLLVALASLSLASGSALPVRPDDRAAKPAKPPGELTWDQQCERFNGTKADTKPCKDAPMAFSIAVEVRQVLVKGGEPVTKDKILIRARDDEQVAVVEGQKLQAESTYRIQNAQLQKELADLNYQRIKDAHAKGSANEVELDQRRIEASGAKVALDQENVQHQLEVKRLAQAEGLLNRYRLTAPFDGIVDEVRVDEGQGVRESDPVIRVVDISRLKLEVYAPTQETLRLKIGKDHKAWILVSLPDKPCVVEGKVFEVAPVADSVSQTRRVQVEFENTEGWPAGIPAMVRFEEPESDWTDFKLVPTKRPISSVDPKNPGLAQADTPTKPASDSR